MEELGFKPRWPVSLAGAITPDPSDSICVVAVMLPEVPWLLGAYQHATSMDSVL